MSELIFYTSNDGSVQLDAHLERETIWLSQKQMALLFEKDSDTIGLHIRNIYKEGELDEAATTEESSVVHDKNGLLRDREGGKRIADNALVAMTLMIAESRAQEKDVITAMLTNLIGGKR